MSSTTSINPTVAFFGATGLCTNTCLVHTLQAGHSATALARTPSKLKTQLLNQGLSEDTLSRQLVIIQGDALDVAATKRTLTAGGGLVTKIVSGLGGVAKPTFSLWRPLQIFTLDNPTICATATQTLFNALQEIYEEQPALTANKPLVTFISSTGVTTGPTDVPFWLRFLYHQVLTIPHRDKKNMEVLYRKNMSESDSSKRLFRNIIGIRPTLLTGGASVNDGIGLDKIRAGREQRPAVGYSIRKADVGHWIFENVIKNDGQGWEGEMVTLTS
jgi:hypothetical protein